MRAEKKMRTKSKKPDRSGLLFAPALLPGEDGRLYAELRRRIWEALKPRDIFEEVLAADLVDIQWEIVRYRRLLGKHLQNERLRASEHLIEGILPLDFSPDEGARLARKRAIDRTTGEPEARKEITSQMKRFDLDEEAVIAAAFARNVDLVEKVTRMISVAEARKNKAFREFEFRRSYRSAQIQRTLTAVAPEMRYSEDTEEILSKTEEIA
jgi:hypothetical protein